MAQRMVCQQCITKGAGNQNRFYLDVDVDRSVPEVRMECVQCHSSIQLSGELIQNLIEMERGEDNGGVSREPTAKE